MLVGTGAAGGAVADVVGFALLGSWSRSARWWWSPPPLNGGWKKRRRSGEMDGSATLREGEGGAEKLAPGRNSETPLPFDKDLPRTLI